MIHESGEKPESVVGHPRPEAEQALYVESSGREGSHSDPLHYEIIGEVIGQPAVIADTLNCHHCISPDEQRAWLERLVHRHNTFTDMLAALKGAMVIIETVGWPEASSDGLRAAFDKRHEAIRAAIAKATGTTP